MRLNFPWLLAEFSVLWAVVVAEVPRFGLQLSCFGHVRAKNNSEFPCRLELCLTFRLGLSPVVLISSQDCEGIVLLLACSG